MTVEKGGDRLVAEMTVRGERSEDLIAIGGRVRTLRLAQGRLLRLSSGQALSKIAKGAAASVVVLRTRKSKVGQPPKFTLDIGR